MSAHFQEGMPGDASGSRSSTSHSYLVAIGSSGAVLAAAVTSLVLLVGIVSFDVWPQGEGRPSTGTVELSVLPGAAGEATVTSSTEAPSLLASGDAFVVPNETVDGPGPGDRPRQADRAPAPPPERGTPGPATPAEPEGGSQVSGGDEDTPRSPDTDGGAQGGRGSAVADVDEPAGGGRRSHAGGRPGRGPGNGGGPKSSGSSRGGGQSKGSRGSSQGGQDSSQSSRGGRGSSESSSSGNAEHGSQTGSDDKSDKHD